MIASTHHPFYYKASTATGEDRPDFADEWVRKVEAFRETLTRAQPDVLLMVGSDHFHQPVARQHAAVPRRARRALRRQLVQRGARVLPATHADAGRARPQRARAAAGPRRRVRPGVQQRACASTTA
nr:hypothetical protein [Angustibacter aerolatus]